MLYCRVRGKMSGHVTLESSAANDSMEAMMENMAPAKVDILILDHLF